VAGLTRCGTVFHGLIRADGRELRRVCMGRVPRALLSLYTILFYFKVYTVSKSRPRNTSTRTGSCIREHAHGCGVYRKLLLRMRIAFYLYAYPEFVYLSRYLQVYRGCFHLLVSCRIYTRICVQNSIVSASASADLLIG